MFKVTLRKIGNSYGVILPSVLLRHLKMKPGDELEVSPDAHRLVISPVTDELSFEDVMEEIFETHDRAFVELAK